MFRDFLNMFRNIKVMIFWFFIEFDENLILERKPKTQDVLNPLSSNL